MVEASDRRAWQVGVASCQANHSVFTDIARRAPGAAGMYGLAYDPNRHTYTGYSRIDPLRVLALHRGSELGLACDKGRGLADGQFRWDRDDSVSLLVCCEFVRPSLGAGIDNIGYPPCAAFGLT